MDTGLRKFLLIGYGNMGSAMISPLVDKFDITVVTPNSTPKINVKLHRTLEELTEVYDIIMFATKPFMISNVLPHLKKENYDLEKTVFLSIMVGIEEDYFKGFLGATAKVARVMPSLPVSVYQGIILVLRKEGQDYNFDFFEPLGKVIYLKSTSDYEKMTSICCCAPGYVYHIFQHYQLACEQMEVETEVDFKEIVYQIFKGTLLHYEQEQNKSIPFGDLKAKVASKKGTTEAGFEKMEDLSETFHSVIQRSTDRAYEIAEEKKKA